MLVCLRAERTSFAISAAVEAATTAQIRRNPAPKRPIPALCRQTIENAASSMPYQKCKATSAMWLTHGAGPDTFAKIKSIHGPSGVFSKELRDAR